MPAFKGFDPSSFDFLRELGANNHRDWFQANKARYESLILEPSLDFIATMSTHLHKISDHFDAIPKRSGGSLMRVYRDTRFSKDKTPYKTNIGIQFRHQLGKDVHAPGFYLHIEPDECFVGVGMWRPDSTALRGVRERIDERPQEWRKATRGKRFRETFELSGDSLKRPPKGFDPDHEYLTDLKRKDHIAITRFGEAEVTSPDFVRWTSRAFRLGTPYMRFLCAAVEVPF
jgi:uncharacterized protein (TIGR02453 family)